MPNWCYNGIYIVGPEEDILELKEYVQEETKKGLIIFSFNKVIPEPEYEDDKQWYWWRLNHWGTKWNNSPEEYYNAYCFYNPEVNPEYIQYSFDTAWSPPSAVFFALQKKFPKLKITWFYEEPGNCLRGYLNQETPALWEVEDLDLENWDWTPDESTLIGVCKNCSIPIYEEHKNDLYCIICLAGDKQEPNSPAEFEIVDPDSL